LWELPSGSGGDLLGPAGPGGAGLLQVGSGFEYCLAATAWLVLPGWYCLAGTAPLGDTMMLLVKLGCLCCL
jgi:hypothetical protein